MTVVNTAFATKGIVIFTELAGTDSQFLVNGTKFETLDY